jgi:hypothetical protein
MSMQTYNVSFNHNQGRFTPETGLEGALSNMGCTPVLTPLGNDEASVLYWKMHNKHNEHNEHHARLLDTFHDSINDRREDAKNLPYSTLERDGIRSVLRAIAQRTECPIAAYQIAMRNIIPEDSATSLGLRQLNMSAVFQPLVGQAAALLTDQGRIVYENARRKNEAQGISFHQQELDELTGRIIIKTSANIIKGKHFTLDTHPAISKETHTVLTLLKGLPESELQRGILIGVKEEFDSHNARAFELGVALHEALTRRGFTPHIIDTSGSKGRGIKKPLELYRKPCVGENEPKILLMNSEQVREIMMGNNEDLSRQIKAGLSINPTDLKTVNDLEPGKSPCHGGRTNILI